MSTSHTNKDWASEKGLPAIYRSCLPEVNRINADANITTRDAKYWAETKKGMQAFRERTIREAVERMAKDREEKKRIGPSGWCWA